MSLSLNDVCVFTSVCEEDSYWLDQYLNDLQRIGLGFCMHFDRCSDTLKHKVVSHQMYRGHTEQNRKMIEFTEQHKQGVLDLVVSKRYRWAMAMDIDETHETDTSTKLLTLLESAESENIHHCTVSFYTLWDHWKYHRYDGPFGQGVRTHLYKIEDGSKLYFRSAKVNGPTRFSSRGKTASLPILKKLITRRRLSSVGRLSRIGGRLDTNVRKYDLVRLHWGLMTEGLRKQHKQRWDRIYGKLGGNTYQIWKHSLEKEYIPDVKEHGLLNHLPSDYIPPIPEYLK